MGNEQQVLPVACFGEFCGPGDCSLCPCNQYGLPGFFDEDE